jgi:hypothetical protein
MVASVALVASPLTRPAGTLSPRGEADYRQRLSEKQGNRDDSSPSPPGERVPEGRVRGGWRRPCDDGDVATSASLCRSQVTVEHAKVDFVHRPGSKFPARRKLVQAVPERDARRARTRRRQSDSAHTAEPILPRTRDEGSPTAPTLKLSASNPVPVMLLFENTMDVKVVPSAAPKLKYANGSPESAPLIGLP